MGGTEYAPCPSLTNQTMSFEIRPATRVGVKPLIGFYGKSSSGKTMSALLVGRGIVGPKGRIVLIDTESGRGSLFSDVIPGGYSVLDIEPPFTPGRYQQAIEAAEAQADIVIVDSLTHCHSGDGGLLDMQEAELDRMAGDDWKKREACKMAAWIKPKLEHKKFIGRLLRLKCGLIACLRGEEKVHMVKDEGKTKIVTDQFSSPIFDKNFIFELLINFETIAKDGQGGYVIPRKITHPSITPLLPKEGEQIGIDFGEALARWCEAPGQAPAFKTVVVKSWKKQTWDLLAKVHGGDQEKAKDWLWRNNLIDNKTAEAGLKSITETQWESIHGEAIKLLGA